MTRARGRRGPARSESPTSRRCAPASRWPPGSSWRPAGRERPPRSAGNYWPSCPTAWTRRWGLDATQIASLPIEGGLAAEVYAGWRLAAVGQRDPRWAAALLAGTAPLLAPDRPEAAWPGNHALAAVLDPVTRAALAAGVIARITRAANATAGRKAGKAGNSTANNAANNAAAAVIAELYAWPGP